MQNRQKLKHLKRENGLKPHFGPFVALIGPFLAQIFFFSQKSGFVTFLDLVKTNLLQKIREILWWEVLEFDRQNWFQKDALRES